MRAQKQRLVIVGLMISASRADRPGSLEWISYNIVGKNFDVCGSSIIPGLYIVGCMNWKLSSINGKIELQYRSNIPAKIMHLIPVLMTEDCKHYLLSMIAISISWI